MHMAWMKSTCGRMKSDFQYSASIVYNNFSFPENPNDKQVKAIEVAVQKVLDARLQFPNSSLADLYNPLTMPPSLTKAHNELDKAVDLAYRPQAFTSEANRMVFLFELYEKYTAGLFIKEKIKKQIFLFLKKVFYLKALAQKMLDLHVLEVYLNYLMTSTLLGLMQH